MMDYWFHCGSIQIHQLTVYRGLRVLKLDCCFGAIENSMKEKDIRWWTLIFGWFWRCHWVEKELSTCLEQNSLKLRTRSKTWLFLANCERKLVAIDDPQNYWKNIHPLKMMKALNNKLCLLFSHIKNKKIKTRWVIIVTYLVNQFIRIEIINLLQCPNFDTIHVKN